MTTAAVAPVQAAPAAASRSAAFFDVDGTLVATTIVHYYAYLRRRRMSTWWGRVWQALFLAKCVGYILLDKINRSWFNRLFYRNYAGMPVAETLQRADDCYRVVIRPKRFPRGIAAVADHQAEGRLVVLVTGSLDFLMRPLAGDLVASTPVELIAAGLESRGGAFTGRLDGPVIGEREKARRIASFATEHGIDLAASFAYGDSIADVPMLELVGHPVAVNPDGKLLAHARRLGWRVETWTLDEAGT